MIFSISPKICHKKNSILFETLQKIVQILNTIHRWTRDEIPYQLVFKPENFSFWPFFAKKRDVTPYKKLKILRNFILFKSI